MISLLSNSNQVTDYNLFQNIFQKNSCISIKQVLLSILDCIFENRRIHWLVMQNKMKKYNYAIVLVDLISLINPYMEMSVRNGTIKEKTRHIF